MKVPNRRHNLLRLMVTALVATLFPWAASAPGMEAFWRRSRQARPRQRRLRLLSKRSTCWWAARWLSPLRPASVRISVADPTIVDALVVSPTQILISGKAAGVASIVIWDETGQNQTFDAYVDLDVAELAAKIHQILPQEPVQVEARGGVITLSGLVSSQPVADHVLAIAQGMVPRKESVVSLLQIPTPSNGEVLLEVKFCDIDRSTMSQFGANLMSTSPAKTVFTTTTGEFSPPAIQSGQTITGTSTSTTTSAVSSAGIPITLGQLLNVFIFRSDINLGVVIQALEQKNLVQILAEPNVLAETGKEASFLAGGEFPFPVVQGATGGVPVVTVQFREYGVKLAFTPLITPEGLIHLKVAPEVSSLDYTNALTIQGFTIPSLSTRSVQSEMVLKDGQSFAIAGLVNNQVVEQFSKIPGLGDLPILGQFFKSKSISKSQDELLVLVTPHIVRLNAQQTPPTVPQFPDTFLKPSQPSKDAPPSGK